MNEERMRWITFYTFGLLSLFVNGQDQLVVQGSVVDAETNTPLTGVKVSIDNGDVLTYSDEKGKFLLNLFRQDSIGLEFQGTGYQVQNSQIKTKQTNQLIDLGTIKLIKDRSAELVSGSTIRYDLEPEQLGDFDFAGSLRAGKDLFSRTLAYEFSGAFYRPRGLDQRHNNVLLNGVVMNKLHTGRPDWNNWGGLNDALRNQVTYDFLRSTPTDPGSLGMCMNMSSLATDQRKGWKLSYANSNSLYQHRLMLTYAGNWKSISFMLSGSVRKAASGFREGTPFNSYSMLVSVDGSFGRHKLNTTLIASNTKRSQSGAITKEVQRMKSVTYNPYWGWLNGKKRNQRRKRNFEPILQLNHYWELNENINLENHLTMQVGQVGTSRIDYGGGRVTESGLAVGGGSNPDPTYYKKLPSYFLRDTDNPDYSGAFLALQDFQEDGQVDWEAMYQANLNGHREGQSIYVLYEDRYRDLNLSFLSVLHWNLSPESTIDVSFSFKSTQSNRFALLTDLMGGEKFLDVNLFGQSQERRQNDLRNIDRWVVEGDRFKYDYKIQAKEFQLGSRWNRSWSQFQLELLAGVTQRSLFRKGNFENGNYPGDLSFGNSESMETLSPFVKGFINYQLNGHHSLSTQLAYLNRPPPGRSYFSNERYSNSMVNDLKTEKHVAADLIYTLRHFRLNMRLGIYYLKSTDLTQVTYYYSDGLTGLPEGDTQAFVQEVMSGVSKKRTGIECALEVPVSDNWKLRSVWVVGANQFDSSPQLQLTSDRFDEEIDYGKAFIKNYHASGGPNKALSVGIDHSNPAYWWIGLTYNYFAGSHVSIAPVKRTGNFFLDDDGKPLLNIDMDLVRQLWKQEELPSFSQVNIVGGKSWKLGNTYIGFFMAIRNLLGARSITGGFEQSRLANYELSKEDYHRVSPLFGSKYWVGNLRTYFMSVNVRI